jgi:hypothetical protein
MRQRIGIMTPGFLKGPCPKGQVLVVEHPDGGRTGFRLYWKSSWHHSFGQQDLDRLFGISPIYPRTGQSAGRKAGCEDRGGPESTRVIRPRWRDGDGLGRDSDNEYASAWIAIYAQRVQSNCALSCQAEHSGVETSGGICDMALSMARFLHAGFALVGMTQPPPSRNKKGWALWTHPVRVLNWHGRFCYRPLASM